MTADLSQISHSELVSLSRQGNRAALARLISKIERRSQDTEELIGALFQHTGNAQVWGFTGPPGAGKSTAVDQVIRILRARGHSVAVVAIDPSSPFTGGAILGDRIRMQQHASDPGVYIRSLATRGRHGGLSHATKEVVMALDASGFDFILVETAGVGQTELDILKLAHTVCVLLVPESGDSIQVMKAGLMEIADIFAVNKSDRPEADKLVRELMLMIGLAENASRRGHAPPVLKTEAVRSQGMDALVDACIEHGAHIRKTGLLAEKQTEFLAEEVFDVLSEQLRISFVSSMSSDTGKQLIKELLEKKLSPYQVANALSGRMA
jgi:LAO/AO transport system kinase